MFELTGVELRINTVPRMVSAAAQRRLFMSRLRQVCTCIGDGWVITIMDDGTWCLDEVPAPTYPGDNRRYYTKDWNRPRLRS